MSVELPIQLPLRPDIELTEQAAEQLAKLADGCPIFIGRPDTGRHVGDPVGRASSTVAQGRFVVGTATLDAVPPQVVERLQDGSLGIGLEARVVINHDRSVQEFTGLDGLCIVPRGNDTSLDYLDDPDDPRAT